MNILKVNLYFIYNFILETNDEYLMVPIFHIETLNIITSQVILS
jgi:hypothetical protein